jgi:hypothetical protein
MPDRPQTPLRKTHLFNRLLKNKHPAVSQGVRRFGKRSPPAADEHLQKPHNAGSRPQARFFNTLLMAGATSRGGYGRGRLA